jgi:hypothetical protein
MIYYLSSKVDNRASIYRGEESPNISAARWKVVVGNAHHCHSDVTVGKVAQRQY